MRSLRLVLPAVLAGGAILAFGSSASDMSNGERTMTSSRQHKRQAAPPQREPAAATQRPPRRPNAILLIFDEFTSDSLLDRHGRIDPVRYPNFAALAADGTWFRNAFSVYDSTTKAVPLILDGLKLHKGTADN